MSFLFSPYCLAIFLMLAITASAKAQVKTSDIEEAIENNKITEAASLLHSTIDYYVRNKKPDSLVNFIFYAGKIAHARYGIAAASTGINDLLQKIKRLTSNATVLCDAYVEAGEYFGSVGQNTKGYQYNKEAMPYALAITPADKPTIGRLENNLATFSQRMGNLSLAETHARRSLQILLSGKNANYESIYFSYNGMGSILWYASKTDSALLYFNKALEALAKTPRTPRNMYYRPAIIYNNLSALYQLKGNISNAIKAMENTLLLIKNFIASKEPDIKKTSAITFQFEATDNLAGIYKELGDLNKTRELLEYSYRQKQKYLTAGDPGIFISQILLGQLYYATREHDKALQYLVDGLKNISTSDGKYVMWQADACNTLALLHDAKHNTGEAARYYQRADSLYEETLQGDYDYIYLDFLRNAALFYTENGQLVTAIAKADKGYQYIIKTEGPQSLSAFYQLLNLAEIYSLSGNYRSALKYSLKGLAVVNKKISTSTNMLDSIKMELRKPKAILQKAKAMYALLPEKNVASLNALLNELNTSLLILERQKSVLTDADDAGFILADNAGLLEFIKKLTLDLYGISGDPKYLDQAISLHESALYNRIRSRLGKDDTLQFANVSKRILIQEKKLKLAVTNALEGSAAPGQRMQNYLTAVNNRKNFIEKLRLENPKYFNLKYASIFKSLENFQHTIPSNTTLIRYFFIEKKLYALVADSKQKKIISIDHEGLGEMISKFTEFGMNEAKLSVILYQLYNRLWAPLVKNIHFKKVIIIPDGILYNLNFEVLTPQPIQSFKELSAKSLLANYIISYQCSLFLLSEKNNKKKETKNAFVAFAPGFSDQLKATYRSFAKDSNKIDHSYLSLLPQPFSIRLALKTKELLGGSAFVNESSTKSTFKIKATNHKIIHIGTHAESNNNFPEYSRLIFAKSTNEKEEDNSMYVNEIYSCNFNADLTVLTACESGRPGYQDGEGMISLAHAFYYAGSESILTGLWKIDEKASAQMLEYFYTNLSEGQSKDEALRNAKLKYLLTSEGRMLAPQYWAGLVIMGNTSPVAIAPKSNYKSLAIAITAMLTAFGIFILWKKSRERKIVNN